jgi:hypothetical protein
MAPDDDDLEGDLYDDEFDFVDDEDDDLDDDSDIDSAMDEGDSDEGDSDEGGSVVEEELPPAPPRETVAKRSGPRQRRFDEEAPPREESRGPSGRNHDARDRDDRGRDDRGRDDRSRDQRDPRDVQPRDFDQPDDLAAEEPVEAPREPDVPANYRVHVYELGEFKRTIDRPFTAEDAELFASEYNRTSKSYSRFAVTGKDDVKPRKLLSDAKAS